MRLNDLTGQIFSNLTVISRANNAKLGHTRWLCRCECGNEVTVYSSSLKSGLSKSCGCSKVKHGFYQNTLYPIWRAIYNRCNNPNNHAYVNYGARGINLSEEFHNSQCFFEYVESLPNYSLPAYTLDRINNDKGCCRGNLRWASRTEQTRNRRTFKSNTSGNKAVYFKNDHFRKKPWYASITINYKQIRLGYFATKEEAIAARLEAERIYYDDTPP